LGWEKERSTGFSALKGLMVYYGKHPMKILNKINKLAKAVHLARHEFNEVGCFNRAASLSYATLLSLVPLLTVSFTVLSAFPVFKNLSQYLQNLIFQNFIAASAETVQQYFQTFIAQTEKLSAFGMIFLLATAVLLVFSMEQAFNTIWHVKRNRKGVTAFLLYWAVITLIPILIATVILAANYLTALPLFAGVKTSCR
jgi:membrane protein